MSVFGLSSVTGGLAKIPGKPSALLTGGLPYSAGLPVRAFNAREKTLALPSLAGGLPTSGLDPSRSLDPSGIVVPTPAGLVDLGPGYNLFFDPTTAQGKILPAIGNLVGSIGSNADITLGDPAFSYSGSDLRILLEPTTFPATGNAPARLSKQLIECTTISIGVYRAKAPVSAAGYIGAKGFARGRRTIAGTIVLTQFAADVLMRFLHSPILQLDGSKDTHFTKVDQLPPFNMTLLFTNEMGYASYCRVLGIELMNNGTTYSQNDMYTEQTFSYMAADMTPLMPVTKTSLMQKPIQDRKTKAEKTVQDVWDKNTPPVPSSDANA